MMEGAVFTAQMGSQYTTVTHREDRGDCPGDGEPLPVRYEKPPGSTGGRRSPAVPSESAGVGGGVGGTNRRGMARAALTGVEASPDMPCHASKAFNTSRAQWHMEALYGIIKGKPLEPHSVDTALQGRRGFWIAAFNTRQGR